MSDLLRTALQYHSKGLAVVPIGNGSKSPIVKEWETKRLTEADLTYWFSNGHNPSGIGIITGQLSGNLAILDFDGENWNTAFGTFCDFWENLCSAPVVETGSGKRHLWVKIPDTPSNFTNRKFKRDNLHQVIELRCNASNNLAPPSLHPSGGKYRWLTDKAELPEVSFNELFQWLDNWAEKPKAKAPNESPANDGEYAPLPRRTLEFMALGANEGDRNTELYEAAKQYEASGRPLELAIKELKPKALEIGLQEREIEATVKSGYNAATEKGFTPIKKRLGSKSEDFIAALATLGYSFRLNVCNDIIEVNSRAITDTLRATMRTQMRDVGYKRHLTAIEDAYTAHAAKQQYHPVKDYLDSLSYSPGENGPYKIATLATYFKDADGVFYTWLKRWMVGAVAKALYGEQNMMLVLDGPQDIGKSYFVRWLGSGLPGYHIEAAINTEDKDCRIRLISKWVWEVAELGATIRKADREALKNFITEQSVTVRKPFGHFDITKPAMASLIGTINNEAGFLNDPTGSRRFYVCELTSIDWGYTALDVNDLWAEAYWLYKQGEPWRLTPDEKNRQRMINARYRVDLPTMEMLVTYYDVDPAGSDWIAAMDIISYLETKGLNRGNQRANLMELSAAMRELGVRRARKNNLAGYVGIKRKSTLPPDEA